MNYPHAWTDAHGAPEPYCAHCRTYQRVAEGTECVMSPERPLPTPETPILPGDVIQTPTGIHRDEERFVVHHVRVLLNGAQSLRARPLENPRGVDWSLYIAPAEPELRILARGVAHADPHVRSLLPA